MGAGTSAGDPAGPRARAGMTPSAVPVEPKGPAAPLEPTAQNGAAKGSPNGTANASASGSPNGAANASANGSGNASANGGNVSANGAALAGAESVPEVPATTARPEGSGRAAAPDAPAPARQWPLLSVLGTTGLGLLIVGLHPFDEAFRIGTILIGVALIGGAVLRRTIPSVGMLAVRSRFTDMVTYGLLGIAIVLLALMTQPDPWLEFPFLEDVVHSTVKTPTP